MCETLACAIRLGILQGPITAVTVFYLLGFAVGLWAGARLYFRFGPPACWFGLHAYSVSSIEPGPLCLNCGKQEPGHG